MSMLVWLILLPIGGVGAVARFQVDRVVTARAGGSFPAGTLVVNISGATILGILAGVALPPAEALLAGTGLVGAYTTFSTWMLETVRLAEENQLRRAVVNVVVSIVLGVVAAACGQLIGEQL